MSGPRRTGLGGGRWDETLLAKLQTLLGERGPEDGRAVRVKDLGVGDTSSFKTTLLGGFAVLARGALTNLALRFKDTSTGLFLDGDDITVVVNGVARAKITTAGGEITGLLSGTAVTQTKVDTTVGRLLKTGDFGLGGGFVGVPAETLLGNVDATTTPAGLYQTDNTTAGVFPAGESPFGQMILIRYNQNNFTQIWMSAFTDTLYTRRYRLSDVPSMSPWRPLFTHHNILGTVSQTGGVPTGKVFEPGSNANGEFVRHPDGRLICYRTLAANAGAGVVWTFPSVFIAAPVVNGNAVATVAATVCMDAAPSTTAATLSVRDKTDARRADTMHLTAIGRWF